MLNSIKTYVINPLLDFIFPKFCVACDRHISSNEHILCLECKYNLPFTNMEKEDNNAAIFKLITKLPIQNAASMLYFVEKGLVREMIHRLKYNNRPEVGVYLGQLMAQQLELKKWNLDAIVPIPLYAKKQNQRGYNQSECLADGIAHVLNIPVINNAVKRIKNTSTQTDKNRIQRIDNVKDAFKVTRKALLQDKHILLIDDILTTGATLAACGNTIATSGNCKISIATAAMALH